MANKLQRRGELRRVRPMTLALREGEAPAEPLAYVMPCDSHDSAGTSPSQSGIVKLAPYRSFKLLLCLLIAGCGKPTTDPELSFSKFDTWKVPASGSFLPAPRGLYADENDTVYVLDDAGRVLVYDKTGKLTKQWEMPEFSAGKPEGVWKLVDGRVAVADTHYHRVLLFNDDGTMSHKFGTQGTGPGQFVFPVTIAQDPKGFIYVGEYGDRQRIQKFTVDGEYVSEFGQHGSKDGEFQRPSGVAWQDGLVYVVDAFNDRIQVFEDAGKFVRVIRLPEKSAPLEYPYDIRLNKKNQIYVIENKAARLTILRLDGTIVGRYGHPGRGLDQFYQPWDLTVLSDGRILIADTGNHRLVELTP
jgi:iron(III) transport system ATP-binding protein